MTGDRVGDMRVTAADRPAAAIAGELERRRLRMARVDEAAVATTAMLRWDHGGMQFATPLAAIRQVLDAGAVTVTIVPGAPAAVAGVFARRGVIHTLFDPAAALGVAPGAVAGAVLLLRHERPCVAIRVGAVHDVVALPSATVADAGRGGAVARLVVPADGRPITIVDMARLIGHLTARTTDA